MDQVQPANGQVTKATPILPSREIGDNIDWYITADSGSLLLWQHEGEGKYKWVDEKGVDVADGVRVKLVVGINPSVIKGKLAAFNEGVGAESYFDGVYGLFVDWIMEDFKDEDGVGFFPKEAYVFVSEGEPYIASDSEFQQYLADGGDDPNYTAPSGPDEEEETEPESEPEGEGQEEAEAPSKLYVEGMNRNEMLRVLKEVAGDKIEPVLFKYFLTKHVKTALSALERQDEFMFNEAVQAVKVRYAEKQEEAKEAKAKKVVETDVVPPVITETPTQEDLPAVETESAFKAPFSPKQYPSPDPLEVTTIYADTPAIPVVPDKNVVMVEVPTQELSISGLFKAARGVEWTWKIKESEIKDFPHLTTDDSNILGWTYGVTGTEDLRVRLKTRIPQDEIVDKVIEGVEFRGKTYPGLVEMWEKMGLIER